MEFNVSEGAAWAVLFSVLSVFTIIAFIASGWFGSPPILEKLGCILLPKFGNDNDTTVSGRQLQRSESVKQSGTADHFLSARNSAGTRAIALSFFASGMGAVRNVCMYVMVYIISFTYALCSSLVFACSGLFTVLQRWVPILLFHG